MSFWFYIKAIGKHWWALMSCAAFTIFGLYVAWANKNNGWTVRGIFILAAILLFVACFLAWVDERKKVILLEQLQKPKLSLKDQTLTLSTSILKFLYERKEGGPKSPAAPRFPSPDGSGEWVREMQEYTRISQERIDYEKNTLGIYNCNFMRDVASMILPLRERGLDCSRIVQLTANLSNESNPIRDEIRVSVRIDSTIEEVGKELGFLGDSLNG
jgi:hypothetical protein